MPLEITFTDQSWSRVGVWMHSPGSVPTVPEFNLPNVCLGWFYNFIFPIGYLPVGEAFGKVDPFLTTRKEVERWKPQTRPYDSARDYSKYGSILSFGQILAGTDASFNPTGENDTRHKAYRGRLINSPTPGSTTYNPAASYPYFAWPYTFFAPANLETFTRASDWATNAYYDNSTVPGHWTNANDDYASGVQRRIYGVLDEDKLKQFVSAATFDVPYTIGWGDAAHYLMSDASYSYEPNQSFSFDYIGTDTVWAGGYPHDETYCRRMRVRHHIQGVMVDVPSNIQPPTPGWNTASPNGRALRFSCYSEILELYSYWENYPSYWAPRYVGQVMNVASHDFQGPDVGLLTFPVNANPYPEGNLITFTKNHEPQRKKFYSLVDDYANDIRASSTISTASALASVNIGDNIQDILKLKDISPSSIRALFDLVSAVVYKRDPTIKEVIDVVSGLRVASSFEYRPEVEFVLRDLPILLSTQLDRKFHLGRGKFKFDFPREAFGRDVKLTTNTRIVLLSPRNNFVSAVLGLRESGLDPSPSRVWHLYPFSFVVDWVAGIGSRMERAEDILLNASSPIVNLVHSYTVSTVVEQQEIDISLPGASVDPFESSDQLEMRGYFREVSRFLPPFRQSRFDFGLPTNAPDGTLVASFVWQILFA